MTPYNALAEQFTFPARHMYATETLKTDQQVVDMDMLANSFMRAPGESVGTFALESAIDELAIELGMDPIELRIRNEPEQGSEHGPAVLVAAYRRRVARGRRALRLGTAAASRRRRREGEWLIGTGCATGNLSLPPLPRRRGADHARQDGPRHDRGAGARHGDGDLDDPDDPHRRPARPAAGAGDHRLRRFLVPRQPARRRLVADGIDRRRGDRRRSERSSSNCSHSPATNRRWPG